MPHHYLFALITPRGRLSQFAFAGLAMLLFMINYYCWHKITNGAQASPYGPYTIALMVAMWSTFCIFSRRLHDVGSSGIWLIPLLIAAIFAFLASLDPELFGVDTGYWGKLEVFADHGIRIVRAIVIAAFVYCVKAGGESGTNAYGPEFGESEDKTPEQDPADAPVRFQRGIPADQRTHLGERRRNGESDRRAVPRGLHGERRRAQGFGRR